MSLGMRFSFGFVGQGGLTIKPEDGLLVSMNGIENASVKNEQSIRNTQCGLTFTLCEPAPSNQRSTRCHSNVMFEGERENSRTDVERN